MSIGVLFRQSYCWDFTGAVSLTFLGNWHSKFPVLFLIIFLPPLPLGFPKLRYILITLAPRRSRQKQPRLLLSRSPRLQVQQDPVFKKKKKWEKSHCIPYKTSICSSSECLIIATIPYWSAPCLPSNLMACHLLLWLSRNISSLLITTHFQALTEALLWALACLLLYLFLSPPPQLSCVKKILICYLSIPTLLPPPWYPQLLYLLFLP